MASFWVLRLGLGSPSADGLHTGQSDLTEYACIRRNRVGGGTARPTALERPVNGSKPATGAARSAPRARGHGLQALTTRPRGACPLTGRDRDVGRTNQIERSLKEVSGLKASRPSAQSVFQSGPRAKARATVSLLQKSKRPTFGGGAWIKWRGSSFLRKAQSTSDSFTSSRAFLIWLGRGH